NRLPQRTGAGIKRVRDQQSDRPGGSNEGAHATGEGAVAGVGGGDCLVAKRSERRAERVLAAGCLGGGEVGWAHPVTGIVGAREMDSAGIAGGYVLKLVPGNDGDTEGRIRNYRVWTEHSKMGGRARNDRRKLPARIVRRVRVRFIRRNARHVGDWASQGPAD